MATQSPKHSKAIKQEQPVASRSNVKQKNASDETRPDNLSDPVSTPFRRKSLRWFILIAAAYVCWLIWLAYAAWVNVQAGNQ